MDDFLDDDGGITLDGVITSRPIEMKDLAEWDTMISKAYAFCKSCSPETQEFLNPVITMAGDLFCEICYEKGINPVTTVFSTFLRKNSDVQSKNLNHLY